MNNKIVSVAGLLLASASIFLHFYQRPPKIAYAESSVLLNQFSEGIQAHRQFEAMQKEWEKNSKQIEDSLTAAVTALKQGYDRASKAEKEILKQKFEKWNTDNARYKQAVAKMSEQKEGELMKPVVDKLNTYMKQWGQAHGYDFILGTTGGGNILQAKEINNVTSALLSDLNEHYKSTALAAQDSSSKALSAK